MRIVAALQQVVPFLCKGIVPHLVQQIDKNVVGLPEDLVKLHVNRRVLLYDTAVEKIDALVISREDTPFICFGHGR